MEGATRDDEAPHELRLRSSLDGLLISARRGVFEPGQLEARDHERDGQEVDGVRLPDCAQSVGLSSESDSVSESCCSANRASLAMHASVAFRPNNVPASCLLAWPISSSAGY